MVNCAPFKKHGACVIQASVFHLILQHSYSKVVFYPKEMSFLQVAYFAIRYSRFDLRYLLRLFFSRGCAR